MEVEKKVYKLDSNGEVSKMEGLGHLDRTVKPSKIESIINIALKLAANSCYDTSNRIIYDGKPIAGSNIINLIASLMMQHEKGVEEGMNKFIRLMKNCNIDPELITNKIIQKRLRKIMSNSSDFVQETKSYPINVLMNIDKNPEYYVKKVEKENLKRKQKETNFKLLEREKKKRQRRKSAKPEPKTNDQSIKKPAYNLRSHGSTWIIPGRNS